MEFREFGRAGCFKRKISESNARPSRGCPFSIGSKWARTKRRGQGIRFDYSLTLRGFVNSSLLITLLGPDKCFAIPINERAGGLALLNQKCVATETWDAGST